LERAEEEEEDLIKENESGKTFAEKDEESKSLGQGKRLAIIRN